MAAGGFPPSPTSEDRRSAAGRSPVRRTRSRGDTVARMQPGGGGRPRAAVVLTGSELVTGVLAAANGPRLAHELTRLGFEVAHLLVVGDRPGDLTDALRFAADAGC